jgi:putative membrane protein
MTSAPESPSAPMAARRLHPASFLFDLLTHVRGMFLPALALLVTARWTNIDLLAAPFAVVLGGVALVRQLSLTYEIRETELVVRRSLIVHRSERHIPFARVHNLKTSATPIHRWLGVVEVAIETASGAEPEATLRVLSEDALNELRTHVGAQTRDAADTGSSTADDETAPAQDVLVAMSSSDLLRFGLLNSRGLVVIGALVGLGWEVAASLQSNAPWDPRAWIAPWTLAWSRRRELVTAATGQSLLVLLLLAVGAFAILKVLSIVWALVSLHRFRVVRTATGLVVERGVFPRTATAIPFTRVQRVVVRDTPLLRLFERVEVQVDTVGGSKDENNREPVWVAPLLARADLPQLLEAVGLSIAPDEAPWQPLHPRAGRRIRTQNLIVLAFFSLPVWPIAGWRTALVFLAVLAPLAMWLAGRQARAIRYAMAPAHVLLQTGWLRRTLLATWVDRVQSVTVAASPFDRRHQMASVLVDTAAGGALTAKMEIPFLDADTARTVAARLAADAAATRFEW